MVNLESLVPTGMTPAELEAVLIGLVEKGKVSTEDVQSELDQVQATTGENAMAAVEPQAKLTDQADDKYADFVENLNLTPEQKEKLRVIITGYDEAVATARELDATVQVPSKEQVIAHIMALGAAKLEKIATIMGKPDLVIETDQSFEQMKDAMDANPHYDNQGNHDLESHYQWSSKPNKVSVHILDMAQNTAVVPGQYPGLQRNDNQLRICEKYFRDNGMRLVNDRQYAAGMQKSLRTYKHAKNKGESNPERHILDFYGQPQKTVTMFNQEHNDHISKVAGGGFNPDGREVYFRWYYPDTGADNLRGRGAVQVM